MGIATSQKEKHIHFHLPSSIAEMSPEQLAALTGGSASTATAADRGSAPVPVRLTAEEVALHAQQRAKRNERICVGTCFQCVLRCGITFRFYRL